MSSSARHRSTSRLLALEPRLLFDGAAGIAVEQMQDAQDTQDAQAHAAETEQLASTQHSEPTLFSAAVAAARLAQPETGAISEIKNTSDDGTVTVGEDDKQSSSVLKDWQVSGSGQITVTVAGQAGGLGTLSHPAGNDLTFTGTKDQVNAWLSQVQYQYTQLADQQKQTGDSYNITLTFTTYNDLGEAKHENHTQRVDVAPQNDATIVTPPVNGLPHATVKEGGTLNFGAAVTTGNGFTHALLGLRDPDNSAAQVIIKLESIPDPQHGKLVLTRGGQEIVLAVGSTLSVAELGNLEYRTTGEQVSPNNGAAKTPLQNFKFTIDDGAGGRSEHNEVNIALTPVNQAPSVVGSVTIVEGESDVSLGLGGKLTATRYNADGTTSITDILSDRGKLSGADADDANLRYTITSLPAYGTLQYKGVVLTADHIGKVDITNLNELTYSYPSELDPVKTGSAISFGIEVRDAGGGAGASQALVTQGTIELTILGNNDDPLLVNNKPQDYKALREAGKTTPDSSFTITKDMLSVSDEDSNDNNLVFQVTGTTDPNLGYFTLNGKLLAEGTSFTMQDVQGSLVKYHLRTSSAAERTDSFTFQVVDSATGLIFGADGKAYQRDGGIYVDGTPNSALASHKFEVKVPAAEPGKDVALPPLPDKADDLKTSGSLKLDGVLESQGSAAGSGDGVKLTEAMLSTTDGVSTPDKIVYRLETMPSGGTLTLNGKVLKQFDSFTQKDINDGNVKYQHQGGEQFADEFQFSVSNGVKTSDALNTFRITSIPQNDTPTASQGSGLNVLEGDSIVINSGGLQHIVLSDRDQASTENGYANTNELWFVVTDLPDHGVLLLNGQVVNVGDKVTQAQLDNKELTYKHGGSEQFKDSFEIQPYDNQKVGTEESGSTPANSTNQSSVGEKVVIHITVAPDNDAPVRDQQVDLKDTNGAKNGLYEGGTAIIWGNDLSKAVEPFGQLSYTDADNTDPQQIQYRLTKGSEYGQLILKQAGGREIVLVEGSTFTQDDLNEGRIEYRHNGGENHVDTFKYLVSDGDHTVNGTSSGRNPGETIQATEGATFSIHVKPSNDKPNVVQKPSKPVVVDGADSGLNKAPGFKVGDTDLPDSGAGGDTDLITVIVRVTDAEGKPLTSTDYTLQVTESTGLQGNSSTSANGGTAGAGYLVLTGSRADVNKALASLEVGFGTDTNAKYQLQVIADDRLNAAGKAYQNGGTDVTANGGDKNRQDKLQLQGIDTKNYKWATDVITADTSFNLAVAAVDLWVSITNDAPQIDKVPGPITVYEDVPTKLTDLNFVDTESSAFGTWVEVTLEVSSGTLTEKELPDDIKITVNSTGSVITLKGAVDKINAFLNSPDAGKGLFYTSDANDNANHNGNDAGDVTLKITLNEGASNIGTPNVDGSSSGDPANGGSAIGGDTGSGSAGPGADVVKTVAITVLAANDAPTASSSGDKVVITNPTAPKPIVGFTVADNNDTGFASAGENDFIQVTVRLLDKNGYPLKQADYKGVTLGIKDGSSLTTGLVNGGVNDVLVLRGTVAEVDAALAKLQITLENGQGKGLGNADNPYQIQIIADDRLRNADGTLKIENGKASANGGDKNNTGTGGSTTVADISTQDIEVYSDTDFSGYALNIDTAERTIWPSSSNALPDISSTPDHVVVVEDVRTFIGGGFTVTDAESDQFNLAVRITLQVEGSLGTLSVGGEGKLADGGTIPGTNVKVVSGDGSGTLVLEGTASAISALLNHVKKDAQGNVVASTSKGLFFKANENLNADKNGSATGDITVKLTIDEYLSADAFGVVPQTATSDFFITVNPVNDAPVIGGNTAHDTPYDLYPDRVDGSNNGWHWTTGADDHDTGADKPSHAPIKLMSNATVSDVDLDAALNKTGADSFGGGKITVTMTDGYATGDILAVGNMPGIDRIEGGIGKDLVIHLSDTANAAQVKDILEAITFDNDGDPTNTSNGTHLQRGFSIVLNDGNNTHGNANAGSGGALDSKPLTGTLKFQRYEAPVATADKAPDTVISGGTQSTTGNVLANDTDKVLNSDPANNAGTDLTVKSIQSGSTAAGGSAVVAGQSTVVEGTYGTLTIHSNGSYTYTLDPNRPAYQQLGGDDVVQETFSYRTTDAQGLSADSTLTIKVTGIDDPVTVTVNPGNIDHTVYESHLPNGSETSKDSSKLGVESSFSVKAPDGLQEKITIDFKSPDGSSTSATLLKAELDALSPSTPKVISTPYGKLHLTGYTLDADTNTATVTYRYTLTTAPSVQGSTTSDVFSITATDTKTGNNTGTGSITITIVDDAPVAKDDSNRITEDATAPATGNVLGGSDASTGDQPDTQGADGATVSKVTSGSESATVSAGQPATLPGQYGTLTLNAKGGYSYLLDNSNLKVQGLGAGESVDEVYTYTIADADGDTTTATLTITITGTNDGVTVQVPNTDIEPVPTQPDGKTNDHVVFESGLGHGSSPHANDTLVNSSFTIKALDGVETVTIGLKNGSANAKVILTTAELEALSPTAPKGFNTAHGRLELNGYTQADDGTITVSYTYTLKSAPQNATASDNLVKETFTIAVTDRDGDDDRHNDPLAALKEFSITIVDDAPAARDDAATLDRKMEEASGNVMGTGGNNAPGMGDAADSQGADGAKLTDISVKGVKVYDDTITSGDPYRDVPRDYDVTIDGTVYKPGDALPPLTFDQSGTPITITDKFGTLVIAKDGSYTFTREPDQKLAIIREYLYTIVDQDGDSSTATLTIYVENRSPIITEQGVPVKEGGVVTPNGEVSESGLPDGSATDKTVASTTGVITFTPGDGKSDITLTFGNNTLVIKDSDTITSGSHTLKTEYGTVTITSYDPAKGKLEYTYTLTKPFDGNNSSNGTDSFDVMIDGKYIDATTGQLEDVTLRTTTAKVQITILDDAPQAVADTNTADATTPATGNVLGGTGASTGDKADLKGGDAGALIVVGVKPGDVASSGPVSGQVGTGITGQYGELVLNKNGTYSYTVDSDNLKVQGLIVGEELTETFTYTVEDGDGSRSTTTLTITIQGADDGVTVTTPTVHGATQPDGNTQDHVVFESGLKGGSATNAADVQVQSSFTVTAPDGLASITIRYVDDQGQAQTRTLQKSELDKLSTSASQSISTAYGTLTLNGFSQDPDTGEMTVQYSYLLTSAPAKGAAGTTDDFQVTATDRDGSVDNTGSISIRIVDDAPTALDDTASTTVDVPVRGTLVDNDQAGADIDLVWSRGDVDPTHGTVTINPDGSYVYTPNAGFIGTDTFTYTVTDKDGSTDTATVTITVTNQPPVAQPDVNTTPEDTPVSGTLTGNDSDPDGHPITVTEITVEGTPHSIPPGESVTVPIPGKGVIVVGSDGGYTFTPEPDWHGAVPEIGYTITDGKGGTDTSTLTITVTPVVDITPDVVTTPSGTPVTTPVLDNDSFEGKTPTVTVDPGNEPSHGTVTVHPDGSITYTPTPCYVGEDEYTYTVTSGGVTETTTVTITVTNLPPVATDDTHVTPPGEPAIGNVITGGSAGDQPDHDPDGQPITVTQITVEGEVFNIPPDGHVLVRIPGKGLLQVGSDGSYTFMPDPMWGGQVPDIGYTISDGYDTSSATLRITSTPAPLNVVVPPAAPMGEIPTGHGRGESPMNDPEREAPWKGNAMRDPSVFWEALTDQRDMRLPQLLHPITYVNGTVQLAQLQSRLQDMLANWSTWYHDQAQLSSQSENLGTDPSLFVQHAVRSAQQERRFWEFLASGMMINLPTDAPEAPARVAADVADLPAEATPVSGVPQASAPKPDEALAAAAALDLQVLLERWSEPVAEAQPAAEGPSESAHASSFRAQLQDQARHLPSHVS